MGFTTCCGLLTLQVGVTVLASVFLTLGAVVFVANFFESSLFQTVFGGGGGSFGYSIIFVLAFVAGLLVIGASAFSSAYCESRCCAFIALLLLILFTAFWIVLSVLSFVGESSAKKTVCHKGKCPASLWLARIQKVGGGEANNTDKHTNRTRRQIDSFYDLEAEEEVIGSLNFVDEYNKVLNEFPNPSCFLKYFNECSLKNKSKGNFSCCNSTESSTEQKTVNNHLDWSKQSKFNSFENHSRNSSLDAQEKRFTKMLKLLGLSDIVKRQAGEEEKEEDEKSPLKKPKPKPSKPKATAAPTDGSDASDDDDDDDEGDGGGGGGMDFGVASIIGMVLFVLNLLFFLFSAIIFWSWAQDLSSSCEWDYYYY